MTELIFTPMQKIARYSRLCTITEKIDGTNASIYISEDLSEFLTASRTRWITPEMDNNGFSRWAHEHKDMPNIDERVKRIPEFHSGSIKRNLLHSRCVFFSVPGVLCCVAASDL